MLCVSHRELGKINSYRLTLVPRGYLRANLLKKDPTSEQLIPPDKSTKLIFSSLQRNIPLFRPFCFPHCHPKVAGGNHCSSVYSYHVEWLRWPKKTPMFCYEAVQNRWTPVCSENCLQPPSFGNPYAIKIYVFRQKLAGFTFYALSFSL